MKAVVIPRKEKKTKRLFVPMTPTEHNKILEYSKTQEVKLTEMVRYALKETFDI